MKISGQEHIGELVAENYKVAAVFKKYTIDFCCQGSRTISDACKMHGLNTAQLISELEEVIQEKNEETSDFKSWPLDLLVDYIEKKHHRYVETRTREIMPHLDKLCKVHGDRHPELYEIKLHFNESAGELARHMKKEELILFPYIRKMVEARDKGETMPSGNFTTIENPIAMMMHEHDNEGARFRKISELSSAYTPPEDACNTYKLTFAMLREFEEDLHLHIHLENNILFPKAKALESELVSE